jgi:uncharacterized protein (DUF1800 family)
VAGPNATREDVARLLGRAAFGATAADLAAWTGQPYASLVDHLLNLPAGPVRLPQLDDVSRLGLEQRGMTDNTPVQAMRQWWLERMRTAQYPLEERLTLLWHDHFATAVSDGVPPVLAFRQIQTLRNNALGNFRALLNTVTVDAAMLRWLNGAESTGGKPNENYARELMELFTLGTRPQVYSEGDVREAARVLTGWTVDGNGKVAFVAGRHDAGTKKVLGATITNGGNAEYAGLLDVLLAQPVAARFVAYKLVLALGYEPAVTADLLAAPDPLVAKVGDSLRASNWDITTAVRTLLMADEFRLSDGGDSRRFVRSPTEVVVGTCKALAIGADNDPVVYAMSNMGQQLLSPPSVGGWPKGRRWLSSSTLVARYGWGVIAFNQWKQALPTRATLPQPADLDGWASFFGLSSLSGVTAGAVRRYLSSRRGGGAEELQAGVIDLILTSPDWTVV